MTFNRELEREKKGGGGGESSPGRKVSICNCSCSILLSFVPHLCVTLAPITEGLGQAVKRDRHWADCHFTVQPRVTQNWDINQQALNPNIGYWARRIWKKLWWGPTTLLTKTCTLSAIDAWKWVQLHRRAEQECLEERTGKIFIHSIWTQTSTLEWFLKDGFLASGAALDQEINSVRHHVIHACHNQSKADESVRNERSRACCYKKQNSYSLTSLMVFGFSF